MKRAICFLVIILGVASQRISAQTPVTVLNYDKTAGYTYENVFEAPGKSKDQIYDALKKWVVRNVISQSNTNYFDDTAKNLITTAVVYSVVFNSQVLYKMTFDIKPGKYRVSATSFTWINMQGIRKKLGDYDGVNMTKKSQAKTLDEVQTNFASTIQSLQKAVNEGSDW